MGYHELDRRLKLVYSKVRYLDDYSWEIHDGDIEGVHKKSRIRVRITTADDEKEAERMAMNMSRSTRKEYPLEIIAVGERGVFSIKHGSFIMTYRYINATLSDINDHIVWKGFKVREDGNRLIQEDVYKYLGGRLIDHIRNSEVAGQDYVFWQFYRCGHCGKYVDLDDVEIHLKGHGVRSYDNSEEDYEIFEINFKDGKVYDEFGKEVSMEKFSEEAREFIRESLEHQS